MPNCEPVDPPEYQYIYSCNDETGTLWRVHQQKYHCENGEPFDMWRDLSEEDTQIPCP